VRLQGVVTSESARGIKVSLYIRLEDRPMANNNNNNNYYYYDHEYYYY